MDPEILRNFTLEQKRFYESWKDWESWEVNPAVREAFPYTRSGYDKDGRVGTDFSVNPAFQSFTRLLKLTLANILQFTSYHLGNGTTAP